MARKRRRTTRRGRRGRFGGLYRFFAFVAVVAAVAVACVIFFRVNQVSVDGNVRYTEEEIIRVSGIETGDNLIALPKTGISNAIRTELPYVESVTIRRRLPDGVVIEVEERVAAAVLEGGGKPWLISSQGKVLEQATADSLLKIVGLEAEAPQAGDQVRVAETETGTLTHVLALLSALEEKGMLSSCEVLDCTATASIEVTWGIYTLKLPRGGDYPYMLRLIEGAMTHESMPQDAPGTFDLTIEDGALHFKREK